MLLSEYIKLLQTLPQDLEVYVARGEWGPVQTNTGHNAPEVTSVYQFITDRTGHWDVDYFPEATASYPEFRQKKVILL